MYIIFSIQKEIALALGCDNVRFDVNNFNRTLGVEVLNKQCSSVYFKDLLDERFMSSSPLTCIIGKNVSGQPIYCDISKMPHLLVAGSMASGKSVFINSTILSIICKASPEEVKLLMIDPKIVELFTYNGIPHLLTPVITDSAKAVNALGWAVKEMEQRYSLFAENSVRNISSFNEIMKQNNKKPLPLILIVIDELDFAMAYNTHATEYYITELAAYARETGIHMVIATQRPSDKVITETIKSNLHSKIAFHMNSDIKSRRFPDSNDAAKLQGKGDMLYYPFHLSRPIRIALLKVINCYSYLFENEQSD